MWARQKSEKYLINNNPSQVGQKKPGELWEYPYQTFTVDVMSFGPQTKLEVQGKARHEAGRRRNSECKINLSSRDSLAAMAVSRPTAQR